MPEPGTNDEVGKLAMTMNAMLDRLERSSDRQRQFVSDASHELRSPVTVIHAQLEVALRRGDDVDWPAVAERVPRRGRAARADDHRAARARARRREQRPDDFDEVDLDEIVLEEACARHGVGVDVSRVSAGRVLGKAQQLARVVHNLLDNARRHAEPGVAVVARGARPGRRAAVDDDGPGIAPEDRERVFERFTRLDEGRARDAGGMGLGLALVKATVERHGGTVSIEEAPLGGARFVVRLPAAHDAPESDAPGFDGTETEPGPG